MPFLAGKLATPYATLFITIFLQISLIHVDSLLKHNALEWKFYKYISFEKEVLCSWRGILCEERECFIVKFWQETKIETAARVFVIFILFLTIATVKLKNLFLVALHLLVQCWV